MINITNTIKKHTALSALILSGMHLYAQDINQQIIPDMPPSPQAEAFNRLGDYQVNNNYGVPDISIPLFEIDHHGYKIPLALHYEASPMKPGYNYDATGMGWTLSGNSCISRTIKDRADEQVVYGFNKPFELDNRADYDRFNEYDGGYNSVDFSADFGIVNFQYDSYNIVLPTGRNIPFFMYKRNNVMRYALTNLDKNVKIECNYNSSSHTINSFTVKDENGVSYCFDLAETGSNICEDNQDRWANVTWLLTSISIPAKGTITYQYNDMNTFYTRTIVEPVLRVERLTSQMEQDADMPRLKITKSFASQCPKYRMRFLKSISYGPTKVTFNYQNNHMADIVVTDCQGQIKKFTFDICDSYLKSLIITGQNNIDRLVYGFDYWRNEYINSNNNYTDYWGNLIRYMTNDTDVANFNMYFNKLERPDITIDSTYLRQYLGTSFVPNKPTDLNYYYKMKFQYNESGSTRAATSPESHGVLKSIRYPNGGYTMFTFENHRFPTATAEDGDFVFDRHRQNIIEGGGFRIKSIVNYAADGTIANQDHYRYGFTYGDISRTNFPLPLPSSYNDQDHIGCGEAVVDPNILTFLNDFSCYDISTGRYGFQKMIVGLDSPVKDMYNVQGSATWWDAEFSANAFRSLLDGRRPVVYPEITVYHGNPDIPDSCISKRVYKYDIYNYQHRPIPDYLANIREISDSDSVISYFETLHYDDENYHLDLPRLMYDKSQSGKRHQLKSLEDYSYDATRHRWDLFYKEEYQYEESYTQDLLFGYIFNSNISRQRHTNYQYQMGDPMWYNYHNLADFYPTRITHTFGQSMMKQKSTTQLHRGEVPSPDNTQTEIFSYLCPGVMKERCYPDMCYTIRNEFGESLYDKKDIYKYVADEEDNSVIAAMKSRNMLASLTSAETFGYQAGRNRIKGSKIEYKDFDGLFLPHILYEANGNLDEESIQVISYCGENPEEIVDLKTEMHTIFLWGPYGRYLYAMIRNAEMSDVESQIDRLLSEDSVTRYASLKTLLPSAQIETWDYIPLIGVSSHTDVNGQTTSYEYDGLGRLKKEKRIINGVTAPEILNEYEYNYMNIQQ